MLRDSKGRFVSEKWVHGYKAFELRSDGKLQCRSKIYELGKNYKEPEANMCISGMHFCTEALEVLRYYPPNGNYVYAKVRAPKSCVEFSIGKLSKCCTTELTIGEKLLTFDELVKEHKTTFGGCYDRPSNLKGSAGHCDHVEGSAGIAGMVCASKPQYYTCVVDTATYNGVSIVEGASSVARVAGPDSVAVAAAVASRAVVGGEKSVGVSVVQYNALEVLTSSGIAVSNYGVGTRFKGVLGSTFVYSNESGCPNAYNMVQVDGVKIKADTWYMVGANMKLVEC